MALVLRILVVAAILLVAYVSQPYVALHFKSAAPDAPWVKDEGACLRSQDRSELVTRLVDGKSVTVWLCFTSTTFESREGIVYKIESDRYWYNDPNSADVGRYVKERTAAFTLSKEGEREALENWRKERNRFWRNGVLAAVASWIALLTIQFIVGWVVRGFLGIPMGQDRLRTGPAPSP